MSLNQKMIGKGKKKYLYLGGFILLLAIVGSLLYAFELNKETVYFYKKGTDIPVVNEPIEITVEFPCGSSPCRSPKVIYDGSTNKEGAIRLASRHADFLNRRDYFGWNSYYIETPHFIDLEDCCGILYNNPVESEKTLLIEKKDPKEAMIIDLGQEFFIGESIYDGSYNTFQLSKIDVEKQSVELSRLIATDVGGKIKTIGKFKLKKGEPAYIPGEVTDSTFVLESLTSKKAVLKYTSSEKAESWFTREPLDLSSHFKNLENEYSYQDALDYFSGIEKEYQDDQNIELNLSPYRLTFGELYAVSPLGIGSNECLYVQFERNGGPVRDYKDSYDYTGWLTGETYLGTGKSIAPCGSKRVNFMTETEKVKWK